MNGFLQVTECARCGTDLSGRGHSMSRFNTDACCMDCLADERLAPDYKDAVATELAAVRAGDFNFPGVGLSAEDRAFLKTRLDARRRSA